MIPLRARIPSPVRAHYAPSGGGAVFRIERSRQNVTGGRYSVSGPHRHPKMEPTPRGRGGKSPSRESGNTLSLATAIYDWCNFDRIPL